MNRHAPLPGAAELFRSTSPLHSVPPPGARPSQAAHAARPAPAHAAPSGPRIGTGRQKHDAKITVYVSDDELVALEQARLTLRAHYGIAIDRGRIVREAIAALLGDFDAEGEDSVLIRRLTGDLT